MNLLDEHYVMFDFVPWGQSSKEEKVAVPRSRNSFLTPDLGRRDPLLFSEYMLWMCRAQKDGYRWLQTDLVAVRRDLVTKETTAQLRNIAVRLCDDEKEGVNCALREMVMEEKLKTEL